MESGARIVTPAPDMHVVLVAPLIPHNTGAVGRLCVALGARLHLVEPLGFRLTDSRLRRAGLDYWRHLDWVRHASWDAFLGVVNSAEMFFFSAHGREDLYECRFPRGAFLIFGNEEEGLPARLWAAYGDLTVRIPMPGLHHRSLNLAMAVGIACYEAYRQMARG